MNCLSSTVYKWEWSDKAPEKTMPPLGDVCGCGGTRRKKEEEQALFKI